jgi:hypothetical protein
VGLKASDDEGVSFGPQIVVSDVATEENDDFPTCVADSGSIYIAYGTSSTQPATENEQPKLEAVRLAISHDDGKTFGRTDVAGKGAQFYMHPRLVLHADGTIDVVYYQGKVDGDAAGSLTRARLAASDGTVSVTSPLATPITYTLDRSSQAWLGDYVGVLARGGALYTTYADNSEGLSHVAFLGPKK